MSATTTATSGTRSAATSRTSTTVLGRILRPGRLIGTAAAAAVIAPMLLAGTASASAGGPGSSSTTSSVTAPTNTATTLTGGVPVGVNFHGMWSSYTDAQRATVLDSFAAAGVDSVRLDVSWIMLQPNNATSYDAWGVSFVDRVVSMANQRGIKPLMMLWLTPTWANAGAGQRALPTNPADYARVAQWAAARWQGKVVGWEVWNETNSPAFLTGADPVAYTRLLRAAYPAFKTGDPNTTVVTAGLEYNDDTWLSRMYVAGAKGYFDAVATHPYQGIADSDPATPDDGTKYTFTHAAAVHNLMAAWGDGAKKLWFTEYGWSVHTNTSTTANWNRGVTLDTQSAYLAKAASVVNATMPYVQRIYWYSDRDTTSGNVQYDSYGIFRSDLSAKPALSGLAAANA